MNMNQIESFLAITKTLNFTAAARQLGIPQSTISRQINDLESQLNVRLFYRTKRDVRLTDEGRTFLPFAKEMADAASKGTSAVRRLKDGTVGHLSLAAAPAAERAMCECLNIFHREYPSIIVDIERLSAGFTLMDEIDSTYDFCFIYSDMLGESEEYDYIDTHTERIGIASGTSSDGNGIASSVDTKDKKELADSEFILLSEDADPIMYMQAMNYCRTHRFTPNIVNTFDDISSLLLSIGAGMGISFLPESVAASAPNGSIAFAPLDDDSYYIPCIAAWRKSLLNPAAALFLNTVNSIYLK